MSCTIDSPKEAVHLMDVDIEVVDEERLFTKIAHFAGNGETHKVMYVNAHCMVISQKDEAYKKILKRADLVYADGISLVWVGRLIGEYLPCRLTAADFMPRFFQRFAETGIRVYMLGAGPGVADRAAKRLRKNNPRLEIVGTHHGYFEEAESEKLIEDINAATPHILMVGMGVPYQEKWVEKHVDRIDVPVVWTIGALFDFLSGRLARGPQWLLDSGFEWLCRLLAEPRRLGRRYVVGNLLFIWYALRWKMRSHRRGAENAEAG